LAAAPPAYYGSRPTPKSWKELQPGEQWDVGTFVGDTWVAVLVPSGKKRTFKAPPSYILWPIYD
jgi:hypothetical protein